MFELYLVCSACRRKSPVVIDAEVAQLPCPACGKARLFPQVALNGVRWFIARANKRIGPFALAQLQDLAASAQLTPADMVWQPGTPRWQEAGALKELFFAPRRKAFLLAEPVNDDEDIFSAFGAPEEQGPLSLKGIKIRPRQTLTMGDFQIIEKLGAGGMGTVYLAHQRSQNRRVALKILAEHLLTNATVVERFYREALVLANLQHPHIVQFCGFGEEKGLPFFAMEHVEGYSSAALLKYLGCLGVADALYIVHKCAEALNHAFSRNVIHRDIKPDNILVTTTGKVKLADLGLAKRVKEDQGDTESGVTLGTPRYMAPEQFRNAKHADHRADIYALGGVLYHFLTGELPFPHENSGELMVAKEQGHYKRARSLNPQVPPRLDFLVDKMLVRDPKHRYQNYDDLLTDLGNLGLAGTTLSFNPILVVPPEAVPSDYDLIEVLLIDDAFENIRLTQQTLDENNIPNNIVVVQNGLEALAFLRRQGKFARAPKPDLIILGANIHAAGSLELLEEIKHTPPVAQIPLLVLATAADTASFLEQHGFQASLTVQAPHDLVHFDARIKSVRGLFLTVAERPARR
jgi:CheY-like chemotaxis protein